jgi:probable rRNA maturation factor
MILNRQSRIPLEDRVLARFLTSVRRELKLGRREVTVCFLEDREIARLNGKFRGKPKPTDVLSFPASGRGDSGFPQDDLPHNNGAKVLGDIAISPQAARRNAKRFGRTLEEEIRILILHGVLHLAGYDHEADHGEMERIETRLRRKLGLA